MGKIEGREIVVMVDLGTTHNFISDKVEKQLQIYGVKEFGVALENGAIVKSKGICSDVVLKLGVFGVKENFFPL